MRARRHRQHSLQHRHQARQPRPDHADRASAPRRTRLRRELQRLHRCEERQRRAPARPRIAACGARRRHRRAARLQASTPRRHHELGLLPRADSALRARRADRAVSVGHPHDPSRSRRAREALSRLSDGLPLAGLSRGTSRSTATPATTPVAARRRRRSDCRASRMSWRKRTARPERASDELLFVNASQVVTCAGPAAARRGSEMRDARGARGRRGARVAANVDSSPSDRDATCSDALPGAERVDCERGVLTPGVRRLAHARDLRPRALRGAGDARDRRATTWRSRGGAAASTRPCATSARAARTSCIALARARGCGAWRRSASTTVEVKSGYGLSLEDELKRCA